MLKKMIGVLLAAAMIPVPYGGASAENGIPQAQTGLSVPAAAATYSSIALMWDKPEDYGDITGYKVYMDGREIASTASNETYYTAEGLDPDTEYEFTVSSVSGAAESEESETLTAKTDIKGKVRDVTAAPYNAKGDGVTLDTAAIQAAIDDSGENDIVLIPENKIFLTGALDLKSNMTLEVNGTLLSSKDAKDFEKEPEEGVSYSGGTAAGLVYTEEAPKRLIWSRIEGWEQYCYRSLINIGYLDEDTDYSSEDGYVCSNVKICGTGTITGDSGRASYAPINGGATALARAEGDSAEEFYDFDASETAENSIRSRIRGRLINVSNAQDVYIKGVTLEKPPCWTLHMIYSDRITTNGVTFNTSGYRNGDGWDPDSSTNCAVIGCNFDTGDDCVAIKSGKNPEGNEIGRPSENIKVIGCKSEGGLGLAVGSEMSGGVSGVYVRDCELSNTRYGIELKANAVRGGYIKDFRVQDSTADRILIHSVSYNAEGEPADSSPVFSDMSFKNMNILGYCNSESDPWISTSVELQGFTSDSGSDEYYVRNISFEDITLGTENNVTQNISMKNCRDIAFNNVRQSDGALPMFSDNDATFTVNGGQLSDIIPDFTEAVEAEKMNLDGYAYEDNDAASGGGCVSANSSGKGTAKARFAGESGRYKITVYYFDENDGDAGFVLYVNDKPVDSWTADKNLGSASADSKTLTSHTTELELSEGDIIAIEGTKGRYDSARLDRVVLESAEDTDTGRRWDFSEYTETGINAYGEITEDYDGLEIHLNSGDGISGRGLVWSAPGTTTSDDRTVSNNRYIVFRPSADGIMSLTFSGSVYHSSTKAPRIYIVPGNDPSCMSKNNSDVNGVKATAPGAYAEQTLSAELDAGQTYYIWPYYYNDSSCVFTVSEITYSAAVPEMTTRNIYESNMLLQRDEPVYIDGTCSAAVTAAEVSLINETIGRTVQTVDAAVSGRTWYAELSPVSDYESTYKIVISADGMEDIVYTNIIFGDQYLFSGQSNMWKQVSYYGSTDPDTYSKSEVSKHLTDKIRVMYTPGQSDYGTAELQFDAQNKQPWRDFSAYDNIKEISAVAYKTAVKLYEETGVPIGVIDNPYPGSYISSWFDSALAIDDCNLGKNGTANERNWYCGRIYPLRNLELSGIFWYQGCADASTEYHDDPYTYYSDMMAKLIDSWRDLFGDPELPFYYTQLTRIGSTIVDENNPNTGAASKMPIKLAQTDVYIDMDDKTNVGLVGTLDIYGAYKYPGTENDANCRNDIHCGQKQRVGDRMANLALIDIYGRDTDSEGGRIYRMGPIYKSSKASGNSVIVTFECSGKLSIMPYEQYTDEVGRRKIEDGEFAPDVLNEFELAGEDGVWYPAKAVITADNQVTVTSDKVDKPVSVRYANKDYSESPNLTDESGLPSYVFSKNVDQTEEKPFHIVTFDFGGGKIQQVRVSDGGTVDNIPEAPAKRMVALNDESYAGKAVLIRAVYAENGTLSGLTMTDVQIAEGQTEADIPENAEGVSDNERYMLWNSTEGMKPLGRESAKQAVWTVNGEMFTAETEIYSDITVTAVYS